MQSYPSHLTSQTMGSPSFLQWIFLLVWWGFFHEKLDENKRHLMKVSWDNRMSSCPILIRT